MKVLQSMDFGKTTVDVLEVDVSSMLDDLKAFLLDKGLMHHSKHGTRTHVFVRQSGPSS